MNSIKEILQKLGYKLSENGNFYRSSPVYRESSSSSVLRISCINGSFIDFSKGIHGNFQELIRLSLGLKSISEAKSYLKDKKFDFSIIKAAKPKLRLQKTFDEAMLKDLIPNHSYWNGRGISDTILTALGGGIAGSGRGAGRYCFPIYNEAQKLVGFDCRLIKDDSFSSRWIKFGEKSKWIYPNINLPYIKDSCILVESIGDCLSLMECGINNVLCTFGVEISSYLIKELIKLDLKKIYICFNNDSNKNLVGNLAAEKARKKLTRHFDTENVIIALPDEKDFNDLLINWGKEAILEWYGGLK